MSIRALKDSTSFVHSSPDSIVNILNDQFSSVFTKTDRPVPTLDLSQSATHRIDESSILPLLDQVSVQARLSSLDTRKSCGSDGVSPFVLKHCAESLALPISLIFQKLICTGTIPEHGSSAMSLQSLKKAVV